MRCFYCQWRCKNAQKSRSKAEQAAARFNDLGVRIKGIDARLTEIAGLQKHIGSYGKTRDVYAVYKAAGFSKKFFSQHEQEIQLRREAKKASDALGLKKTLHQGA